MCDCGEEEGCQTESGSAAPTGPQIGAVRSLSPAAIVLSRGRGEGGRESGADAPIAQEWSGGGKAASAGCHRGFQQQDRTRVLPKVTLLDEWWF